VHDLELLACGQADLLARDGQLAPFVRLVSV
jgi:hypothetical protein